MMKIILEHFTYLGRKWCVVDWSRWNAKEKCVSVSFVVDVDDVRNVVIDFMRMLIGWNVYNFCLHIL